jgi:lysophospholipid acyltransferase (LPLAT)-like uncharacterized protein
MVKLLTKEKKRALLSFIIPPILNIIIRFIHLTVKKRFHLPNSVPNAPFMVAFWHGKLLLAPFIYQKLRKNAKIGVIISDHFDGEIIARTMGYFGFDTIRGSSSKGGIKALKESFRRIGEGYDIAITPDGPRGPYQSVADGIVSITQKKEMMIIAFNYKSSAYWELKSWDKFMIPKPFSTMDFYASEPFSVVGLSKDAAKEKIKEKLNESI